MGRTQVSSVDLFQINGVLFNWFEGVSLKKNQCIFFCISSKSDHHQVRLVLTSTRSSPALSPRSFFGTSSSLNEQPHLVYYPIETFDEEGEAASGASLRLEKDWNNIDFYRRFINKFSLFLNQSEALVAPIDFQGGSRHCHYLSPIENLLAEADAFSSQHFLVNPDGQRHVTTLYNSIRIPMVYFEGIFDVLFLNGITLQPEKEYSHKFVSSLPNVHQRMVLELLLLLQDYPLLFSSHPPSKMNPELLENILKSTLGIKIAASLKKPVQWLQSHHVLELKLHVSANGFCLSNPAPSSIMIYPLNIATRPIIAPTTKCCPSAHLDKTDIICQSTSMISS